MSHSGTYANRRSGRIMLTIQLLASGMDANNQEFECEARTVSVNRYGARIQLQRTLATGQLISLVNLVNQRSGKFRIVGYLGKTEEGNDEWGVETAEPELDFWGIHFPPVRNKIPESTVLLECATCHTISLLPLSLPEAEVLEAGAHISKFCFHCEVETEWSYPEKPVAEVPCSEQPPESKAPNPVPASPLAPAPTAGVHPSSTKERKNPRHYVQRPITVRDSSGFMDVTRTENVSKGGLCLTSERIYVPGQEVTLIWPHPASGQNMQALARVVRRHDIGGTQRKIYGLRQESAPVLLAASPRSAEGLYWKFGALVSGAAALVGAGVFVLAANLAFPQATWAASAELAAAAIVLYLAHKTWAAIPDRESARPKLMRGSRRMVTGLASAALAGAIVVAGAAGFHHGQLDAQTASFLNDLTVADAIEARIDGAEALSLRTPQGYSDACATLEPLSHEWQDALRRVSGDAARLSLPESNAAHLSQVLAMDEQKLRLAQEQAALRAEAAKLPPDAQLGFWLDNYEPLRDHIQRLSQQKDRFIGSLAGSP